MPETDDELKTFEATGALPLPQAKAEGVVHREGADIWFATYGQGPALVLLHGGLGNSGNWGYQVPELVRSGRQVILIDSRGHGRSTRDGQPYSYQLMADDVLAVMDRLAIDKAALVGWSDGACTALILADRQPQRVNGVFFLACNMDPTGTKPFVMTPVIERCFNRHKLDYAALSATPGQFDAFVEAVSQMMSTEPNYSADDLARIKVPVAVVLGEHDEFITFDHARYLAKTIPDAELILLHDVSHFAPLQRPAYFNSEMLAFLNRLS